MDRNTNSQLNERFDALTVEERETLRVALQAGYFDVPRTATLVDIADELDRSDVEVSQQIRRGMGTVLRSTDVLSDPAVTADGGTDRSLDRMFDALSHPYRRRILLLVSEHNPRDEDEFSVEDLATEDDDLELLTTELYHAHLPKLAEAGYIEWDEDMRTIRRGPNFDEIAPLLHLMHDHQEELPEGWP
ncbi:helix-turn-helix domain-containing protein [Halorarius halobius]|uniref:helix-turn-helix domain-containing protein n=1 Tax=Halorarius halobius TaxID=2962671 RepID=UPI0020CDBC71|nr:helix-turn-helix domain-containing protein [Halorarius halobius]